MPSSPLLVRPARPTAPTSLRAVRAVRVVTPAHAAPAAPAPAPRPARSTRDQRRAAEFVAKGDQLRERGRARLAAECYRQAIAYDRSRAAAFSGLANALWEMGRHAEAIERFEDAVALDPAAAAPARALADAYSLTGQSMPAIKYYRQAAAPPRRRFATAPWDGTPLRGRRLLVHAGGSVASQLAMARLLPALAQLDGTVVLECHPTLVRLLGAAAGAAEVVPAGRPLPAFDAHASLASLPRLLGNRAPAHRSRAPLRLPAGEPPAAVRAVDRARGALRVGLAWAGDDPAAGAGAVPLASLLPLLRAPGAHFFALERGEAAGALAALPPDHQPLLTSAAAAAADLLDVARVVARLDLVIAVDGVVAQLALALGRPVWLVLPQRTGPAGRRLSPPGTAVSAARVFRQHAAGDWDAVGAELLAALAEISAARP